MKHLLIIVLGDKMLRVKKFMTDVVEFVKPSTSIKEVSKIMKENDIGVIPVCNENKELLGIVTDRDIVIRGVVSDDKNVTVDKIMTSDVITASPDDDIYDISKKMVENKIRRIPIVKDSQLVGMVSIADLANTNEFSEELSIIISEISK